MSGGTQDLLGDTFERIVQQHAPLAPHAHAENPWPSHLWKVLEEIELPRASLDEHLGGGGIALPELFGVLFAAGRYAVGIPLVESLVAGRLASIAGLKLPAGVVTIGQANGVQLSRRDGQWRVSGTIENVPWGRQAQVLVFAASADGAEYLVALKPEGISAGKNYADEPRDQIDFTDAAVPDDQVAALDQAGLLLVRHMACARSVQMAGAMAAVQTICVDYVKTRVQFGRTLAQFQAIQQSVAQLAEHVEAAAVAADCGWTALGGPHEALWTALSKTRLGEAATLVAAIAHQVHGAIGFTREYQLQLLTRRLWSWREEFGNERFWGAAAGRALATAPKGCWPALTDLQT